MRAAYQAKPMPVPSAYPKNRRKSPVSSGSFSNDGLGETRILKWKDGKRAAFMVEFDDSAPTHLEFAIPALKSRGIPGTFYINPGNGPYKNHQAAWEREATSPGIELANHTFSHIGGATVAEFEREIVLANEVIDRLYPQRRRLRLRDWARPGVPAKQWGVSETDIQRVLAKHHMIERPPFYGPPFSIKTEAEMREWIDGAIAEGEMRHLVFHGVGGDWHSVPLSYFLSMLDKLEAHADELWITDPLALHKYVTERASATVGVLDATASLVRLSLHSQSDPYFYDQPLSLATRVPPAWTRFKITQGGLPVRHAIVGGEARYDAVPGLGEIMFTA